MEILKRTDRQLRIRTKKNERVALVYKNKETGEEKELRAWFMPAVLNFEAESVWYELEKEVNE